MNNTIEFVLRMRDMMSSNITRVSSTSQSAFNRMSQSANQTTDRNRLLAMSFSELQNRIRQVEDTISRSNIPSQIAEARRELASLQRMSNNHIGNTNSVAGGSQRGGLGIGGIAMGSMIGGLATGAITMGAQYITDGIGTMIQKSMDKETAINGLSTFLGKDQANATYKNIEKDAESTPFDTASLLEVNRSLISAGLNAKTARTDSMNLANAIVAVGGSNDTLTRMAANMQQIKTLGKASAIDVKQFGMAGINIYELLSRSTGKSIDQVREMDVTYEQLSAALAMGAGKGGLYYKALENAQNSLQGKWSNVQEKMTNTLARIGTAFGPLILKVLDGVLVVFEKVEPYIIMLESGINKMVTYFDEMSTSTGGWMDYLIIAQEVFSSLYELVQKAATTFWNIASSMFEFAKNSEFLKDLFAGISWIVSGLFTLIGWGLDLITWYWDNKVKPMLAMFEMVYRMIKLSLGGKIKVEGTFPKMPKVTGQPKPEDTPLGSGAALMGNNNASGKAAGETVSGAGPKVVNIHVGKFFDNLQFTTMNAGESANEIERIVMECFARVVYNGSKMV